MLKKPLSFWQYTQRSKLIEKRGNLMSANNLSPSSLQPNHINHLYSSRHFDLHQLAEGVYAAINAPEGWAICNAGIIDLGDRTLVYDTFTAPQAAEDLRQAAEILTGRPAQRVINSHFHNDHIWGNQAFGPQVEIISTAKTRDLIITEGAAEVASYREVAPARLEALEKQYMEASDEYVRQQLRPMIYDYQAIVAALPILQPRLPDLTFTGEMTFHGTKRTARLIPYDNGHCGSDAILYIPGDNIVFMEDLLFIDCHPYLADGDPDVIQRILGEVKALNPSIVVPGHGPVGSLEHLDVLDRYISQLKSLAEEAIKNGFSEDDLSKISVPSEYRHFLFSVFFTTNLQFIFRRSKQDHPSLG
jgi:cyclase